MEANGLEGWVNAKRFASFFVLANDRSDGDSYLAVNTLLEVDLISKERAEN